MSRESQKSPGRADILAAAEREFADRGFAGATTSAIARRAGVTQPLMYHHFGSKQGLWNAVLADLFGELQDALERAAGEMEGADRRTRIAHLLRAFVRCAGKRPEIGRLIRAESSAGGPPFDDLYERWLSGLVEFFRQELAAAVEDGTFRQVDPQMAFSLILGAGTGPFSEPKLVERAFGIDLTEEAEIDRYADFVVEALMRSLGTGGN